jgi:ABC-type branched-subunit amino acid transport system substrate-binding protein
MRVRCVRTLGLATAALVGLALGGCGSEPTTGQLTIAVQAPNSGPLEGRAADMRRAAQLGLDAIKSRAAGHKLKLVIGPYPGAVASIDALADRSKQVDGQLLIELSAPARRIVASPGAADRKLTPRIWLVPPRATALRVTREYADSGVEGAAGALTDDPRLPGTPDRRYVTAALSRDALPPSGGAFFDKFNEKFGRAPDRWAIYAYEAVGLIVDALHKLKDDGTPATASTLAAEALTIRNRFSPLGHYDVLPSGQSTFYTFQARGPGAPEVPASLLEALR